MGQQQLLLIVLGIVVVGLAVVGGIQAFSVNQKKANADALVLTGMGIAAEVQVWLRTSKTFGGGLPASGVVPAIADVTVGLTDLGYSVNGSDEYVTVDGKFTMTNSGSGIYIEGTSWTTSGAGDNNSICIEISGLLLNDITTAISQGPITCG